MGLQVLGKVDSSIGYVVFFREALAWEHGNQFICVAYQNRVARAMGGVTLHTGGDVGVGEYDKKLEHTDVDIL